MNSTIQGKPKPETIEISGLHLFRLDEHVIVRIEIDGLWVEVMRERYDGAFSHIVEPDGMRDAAIREVRGSWD